ncbi:hypothetical protein GCM10022215_43090 [Nocardioides fonticola]|uniref:Uncharacterized protein n=2 Tax=Nocardioides fonticola TaxID=450363 RepID=A0ABP7Y3J5_9ACTN
MVMPGQADTTRNDQIYPVPVSRRCGSGTLVAMDITSMTGGAVQDQFDVSLEDADLLGEVELTTNLIIAASEVDEHLSQAQIDEILGLITLEADED